MSPHHHARVSASVDLGLLHHLGCFGVEALEPSALRHLFHIDSCRAYRLLVIGQGAGKDQRS